MPSRSKWWGRQEHRDRHRANSDTTRRVKVDIHGLHQNGWGHITCKEGKARVLTETQQGVMDHWIRDDAELLHVLLEDLDIDNVQFGFGNVLIVEFTETFKRGVLVDEFEHKFTGSISGDAGDVNFELAHVIAQVRIFAKP